MWHPHTDAFADVTGLITGQRADEAPLSHQIPLFLQLPIYPGVREAAIQPLAIIFVQLPVHLHCP